MKVKELVALLKSWDADDEVLVEDSNGNISYLLTVSDCGRDNYVFLVADNKPLSEDEL